LHIEGSVQDLMTYLVRHKEFYTNKFGLEVYQSKVKELQKLVEQEVSKGVF